ncbi:MAG: hypothetical protein ABL308_04680 [Oceanicaulis sp.]
MISLLIAAACGAPEAGPGAALVADAQARASAEPGREARCALVSDASVVAFEARLTDAQARLNTLHAELGCGSARLEDDLLDAGLDALGGVERVAMGADRALWRVYAMFDATERRGLDHFEALPGRCRTVGTFGAPIPELAEAFLADPERRPAAARREAREAYAVCAERFAAAAADHAAHGEDGWASWWLGSGAGIPFGGGAELLLAAADEAAAGERWRDWAWYAPYAAEALFERAEQADFDAVATLMARPDLAAQLYEFHEHRLAALRSLSWAAGLEVRHGPLAPPDEHFGDLRLRSYLETWISQGLLDQAPARLQALCGLCGRDGSLVYAFPSDLRGQPGRLDCALELTRLRTAAAPPGEERDRLITDMLTYQLMIGRRDGAPPPDILDTAAQATHAMLETALLLSGDEPAAAELDVYGCTRPGPALAAVWAATAPDAERLACDRLAALAPDPDDPRALAAAVPFTGCAARAWADAGSRPPRALGYAVHAGSDKAYRCLARFAALRAKDGRWNSDDVLAGVLHGVNTGRLPPQAWEAAAGPDVDPADLEWSLEGYRRIEADL